MSAKGAPQPKVVNGFQHAGLAAAIAPDQNVEAGRQLETGLLDIAKVAELEFDQDTTRSASASPRTEHPDVQNPQ